MTPQASRRAALVKIGSIASRTRHAAIGTVLAALAATSALLPFAARPGPLMPGFLLLDETALFVAYAVATWMLFAQFRRDRATALLIAAAGTLFSASTVALHLLSVPGVFAVGPLVGEARSTTGWLWVAWHLGPPCWGLAVAAIPAGRSAAMVPLRRRRGAAMAAAAAVLALACVCAAAGTVLPAQSTEAGYHALLVSGIGPALVALTLGAAAALLLATRGRRSTLDLWTVVALELLVLDDVLTLAGGARGSIGWTGGRLMGLASASAVIWATLHEVAVLRAHDAAAVAELAAAEIQLRAAQKMEAVGRLTAGVAHDFNNLLMVVTTGFDTIRQDPGDRARVLRMAEAGLQAAERGTRLTRQLLSFSRRQSLRPEIANPNTELMEFERLAGGAAGETVRLNFALDASAHLVLMDTAEFKAAVLNLVMNAKDAMAPRGGRVTISSRNAPPGDTPPGVAPGEHVVVAVADTGRGMTAELAAQAFEPFFTTKAFGAGAGLGLSQVYGFARAAGGAAVIHSAPGRGATVELWLPRASQDQVAAAEGRGGAASLRRAREGAVVLAVEDEPDVLASVVENLTSLGYHVLPARDATEALDRLRGDERIDLLFSDVVMPGDMTGVQLATEAALLRPCLRVLLTSGYANLTLEGDHALPAHLDILPKPYFQAELAARLHLVMRAA